MKYIPFGQEKRELSEIVLGMMRISDKSVKEVEELVETALSIGINAFDLADIYGGGRCEELLGQVLKHRPDLRDWRCTVPALRLHHEKHGWHAV